MKEAMMAPVKSHFEILNGMIWEGCTVEDHVSKASKLIAVNVSTP